MFEVFRKFAKRRCEFSSLVRVSSLFPTFYCFKDPYDRDVGALVEESFVNQSDGEKGRFL